MQDGASEGNNSRPAKARQNRNPFPKTIFFEVPIPLYESGLAARMRGSQFKRYITLLRVSNYDYGSTEVKMNLMELERLDGVSPRSAFTVHTKLQELGLIDIFRTTRPHTIKLTDPFFWPVGNERRLLLRRSHALRVVADDVPFSPAERTVSSGKRANHPYKKREVFAG